MEVGLTELIYTLGAVYKHSPQCHLSCADYVIGVGQERVQQSF